jgi:glycosyltransferase involved in cell wall biosynthesis
MEALACGTPAVAFDVGGIGDLIEHQRCGYLARPHEVDDLAHGLAWVLEHPEPRLLAQCAREKVERDFTLQQYARRYQALFEAVAERSGRA